MMPHEPVRDIMRRTIENLEFIEEHASTNGPYEVTQLVNSFLGALAHPWEKQRQELNVMSLADAQVAGWPNIVKELGSDREPTSLGDLVRLVRNALAHGNIAFLPGKSGDIRALRVWNNDQGRRTWGAIVTVEHMRAFLLKFVRISEQQLDQQRKVRPQTA